MTGPDPHPATATGSPAQPVRAGVVPLPVVPLGGPQSVWLGAPGHTLAAELTPVEQLATTLGSLASEHAQMAASYDRDREMESFHRGVAAGLTNVTGRLRHDFAPQWAALAADRDQLRADLEVMESHAKSVTAHNKVLTADRKRLREGLELASAALGNTRAGTFYTVGDAQKIIREALEPQQ